jgi:hypothetical protein
MNYCKNCTFGDFSESRFNELKGKGYGVCNKLVAQTTNGDAEEEEEEKELVSIELQPLTFGLDYTEIGVFSEPIDVHLNFGCMLYQRKPSK